jgi:hypothetical protein
MKKEELIQEYKNYCSDLNINYKSKNSKDKFIYDYLKHLHNIGRLNYFEDNFYKIQNDIRNILKEV